LFSRAFWFAAISSLHLEAFLKSLFLIPRVSYGTTATIIMIFSGAIILGVLAINGMEIFLQLLVRKLIYGILTGTIFSCLLLAVLAFFPCLPVAVLVLFA
jgi:hypothetical protein